MTITIPNHQIETKEPTLVEIAPKLYIESMSSHHQKVLARNTMHGLTLIQNGSKEVELKGSRFKITKNQAVFFAQGNYFSNRNSKDYRSLTLFFDDGFIIDFIKKHSIKLGSHHKRIVIIEYKYDTNLLNLISYIATTHQESKPKQKEILKLQIELLFLEFYQSYPQKVERFFLHIMQTSNQRMRYILEENIDIIEKVSDMQRLLRMSPSHLQKQFYKIFQTSPKIWLDGQRIEKAKFLLSSTSKTVTEVASECGYSTSSWFIVQFKKYCKTTPKEYRIKNRYK